MESKDLELLMLGIVNDISRLTLSSRYYVEHNINTTSSDVNGYCTRLHLNVGFTASGLDIITVTFSVFENNTVVIHGNLHKSMVVYQHTEAHEAVLTIHSALEEYIERLNIKNPRR